MNFGSHNYTVSQKINTTLACYNFNVCQLILIIFGGNVTNSVTNSQIMIYFSASL